MKEYARDISPPLWLKALPLLLILSAWELTAYFMEHGEFFFGSPSSVAKAFLIKTIDGSLLYDMGVTLFETVVGFCIGNVLGSLIGLGLWYFPLASVVFRPYIVFLGSIPVFAVSPIIIVWLGIGIVSKVVLAAISVMVVSIVQAHEGASQTDNRLIELLYSMGADKWTVFKKVIIPSVVAWLFAGYRMNVGFALLGAFIGEFIAAERGLGHLIVISMGLFNMPMVLTGVIGIGIISLVLIRLVGALQTFIVPWKDDNAT